MLPSDNDNGSLLSGLNFRHLQLHPAQVRQLENSGIRCITDISSLLENRSDIQGDVTRDAISRVELFKKHVTEAGVDWVSFWNEQEVQIHWIAMTLPDGLIEEAILDRPLRSLQSEFGALLNIPRAVGLDSLRDIVSVFHEGTPAWSGYGHKKVVALGMRLQKIAAGQLKLEPATCEEKTCGEITLPPDVLNWDMAVLGLGKRGLNLRRRGFDTVGSLLVDERVLLRLPNVGRRTISLAIERVQLLSRSIEDGKVDLERLAALQELEIIPAFRNANDLNLRDAIKAVLRNLSEQDGSDAAMPIFEHRICTGGSDLVTLEEIADMLPVKITRERVRQIEKRILGCAAELFLSPFPIMGKVIIRPVLSSKFRDLARAMEGRDQVSPEELALLIASEWECTLAEAVDVLPMVMAVIEGTARTFHELRRLVDSPAHLFVPLEGTAGSWSAQNIGAERSLSLKLEACSINNLEELRLAWIGGLDFGRHHEYVQSVLAAAGERDFDEDQFANRLGEYTESTIVPADVQSWREFIASLPTEVRRIIRTGTYWTDAEQIFEKRTASLPNERITMDALGQRLGRLGVTVKKTETETLERLASSILHGREGYSQCIFRPAWLRKWRTLKQIHERFPNDQKTFRRSIEEAYAISDTDLTMAIPTIWAILTGLPSKQSFGRATVKKEQLAPTLTPIKLAGFRSLH